MYKKQSATRSLLVRNLPGIFTTPQAKRRFKYLSCINKDYWLIDWLIDWLNTNCNTNSLRTKIFQYATDVYAIFVSLNKGENHKDQLTSELEHLPVSKQ